VAKSTEKTKADTMTKHEIIDVIHKSKCPMLKGLDFEKMTKEDVIAHLQKAKCPEIVKLTQPLITEGTKQFYNEVSLEERQKHGMFYSDKRVSDRAFAGIDLPKDAMILEPSCGSGQFLQAIQERGYNMKNVIGVELEAKPYELAKKFYPEATIIQHDFLTWKAPHKFDLIIGNPPYLTQTNLKSSELKATYKGMFGEYYDGIPLDLYIMFVIKCIGLLKEGGILSFVIPDAILSNPSSQKARDFIHKTCTIVRASIMPERNLFPGANVKVMSLVLRKGSSGTTHLFPRGGKMLFTHKEEGKKEKEGTPIKDLGKVNNGSLSPDKIIKSNPNAYSNTKSEEALPIIYAENIKGGKLVFKEQMMGKLKKQYILKSAVGKPPVSAPFVVFNRTIGSGRKLEMAYVSEGAYFIENHVLIFTSPNVENVKKVYDTLNKKDFQDDMLEDIRGTVASITVEFLKDVRI